MKSGCRDLVALQQAEVAVRCADFHDDGSVHVSIYIYKCFVQGEGEGSEDKDGSLAEIQGTEEDEQGEDEYQNNTDDV